MSNYEIIQGNALNVADYIEAKSINTCVTSPPYFGLRDYGIEDQIGLEATPDEYVHNLVEVFRGVRKVLRDDGTIWVNLGDSYASSPTGSDSKKSKLEGGKSTQHEGGKRPNKIIGNLKPKDLIGIPWRVAFALQADGWYLRQDIIWSKPNPMPESVTDRCTKAHEYIFLLSKNAKYHYDHQAVKEPIAASSVARLSQNIEAQEGSYRVPGKTNGTMKAVRSKRDSFKREGSKREQVIPGQSTGTHRPDREDSEYDLDTRNKRSVWSVATKPYKEAHFATFPPELITPCILAGCPKGGTVLDVFNGSGTTGEVSLLNGCNYKGIELNPDYIALTHRRLDRVVKLIEAKEAQLTLF